VSGEDLLALAAEDLACDATSLWPPLQLAARHSLLVDALEAVERRETRRLGGGNN
jgi:hypothetical protein